MWYQNKKTNHKFNITDQTTLDRIKNNNDYILIQTQTQDDHDQVVKEVKNKKDKNNKS